MGNSSESTVLWPQLFYHFFDNIGQIWGILCLVLREGQIFIYVTFKAWHLQRYFSFVSSYFQYG